MEAKVEWAEGDVLDVLALEKAFEGVTYVIHTAAIVSFIPKDQKQMYQINVQGTANVVNLALEVGVKKAVSYTHLDVYKRQAKYVAIGLSVVVAAGVVGVVAVVVSAVLVAVIGS